MKISIVVPAFNEEKLLAENLRSMQEAAVAFHPRGWEVELIVCNNNSTDRTAEIARAAGARVVFEAVNQIGRARNRGAAAASGDWILFIDADSQPSHALFNDVTGAIASGKYLAGGATIRPDAQFATFSFLIALWNTLGRAKRWFAGSFIFCEARAFRAIGGFNPELFATEEIDLSRRLKLLAKKKGQRTIVLVRHPLVTSARKMTLYDRRERLRFFSMCCAIAAALYGNESGAASGTTDDDRGGRAAVL